MRQIDCIVDEKLNATIEMFLINQVSKLSKVSISNIRHYEKLGLISGTKTEGVRKTEYIYYDQETIDRLELIEECRSVGMSIDEITSLIRVWYGQRISNYRRVQILKKQLLILKDKESKIQDVKNRVNLLLGEMEKFV